jgi:2-keto-4-pentenoate hydratase
VTTAQEAADRLWEAEQTGVTIEPLLGDIKEGDVEAAYEVQVVNTARAVALGRRLIGRKIGLTSLAVQEQFGVYEPDFGALYADTCFGDAEPIPAGRVLQPRVEGEVAIVLARDLPHRDTTIVELMSAVDYVVPAIEVVASRITGWNISIVDTIADNASSGAFVLGNRPVLLRDVDLRACKMQLTIDGEVASEGVGEACLGHPLNAALWLARTMATRGTPMRAGDVIMSGALGRMAPIAAGQRSEVVIEGLGAVRAIIAREETT